MHWSFSYANHDPNRTAKPDANPAHMDSRRCLGFAAGDFGYGVCAAACRHAGTGTLCRKPFPSGDDDGSNGQ
jgi:hypothetical protein